MKSAWLKVIHAISSTIDCPSLISFLALLQEPPPATPILWTTDSCTVMKHFIACQMPWSLELQVVVSCST